MRNSLGMSCGLAAMFLLGSEDEDAEGEGESNGDAPGAEGAVLLERKGEEEARVPTSPTSAALGDVAREANPLARV